MKSSEIIGSVIGVVLILGLLVAIGYFASKYTGSGDDSGYNVPVGRLSLYEPILSFQKKNSRWPINKDELKAFVTENKIDINLDYYPKLVFKPQADGSLKIEYAFKSIAGIESGTHVFSKP